MKFKSKIALVSIFIILASCSILTFISSSNTEKLSLEMMETEGFTLAENVMEQIEASNDFVGVVDSFLETKILQASKAIDYSQQELWTNEYFMEMAKDLDVAEINIIGLDRKTKFSNIPDYIDWAYPKGHAMDVIFDGQSDTYMEDVRENPVDQKFYKYGGSNLKSNYYVQVGITASEVNEIKDNFGLASVLANEEAKDEIEYALFIDPSGLATIGTESMLNTIYEDAVTKSSLSGQKAAAVWSDENTGLHTYDVQVPVIENGVVIGSIAIGFSLEHMDAAIKANVQKSLLTTGLIIIIALIIIYIFAGILVKPLSELAKVMSILSKGDFTSTISQQHLNRKDEIGDISRSLHEMQKH